VRSEMCIDAATDRTDPRKALVDGCQLMGQATSCAEPLLWRARRWQRAARKRVAIRTRLRHLRLRLSGSVRWTAKTAKPTATRSAPRHPLHDGFKAGDLVRVRSLDAIVHTLDESGRCGGCAFLRPMSKFCGRRVRVARRVDHFFDERTWRMLKCKNVVLLEGTHCDGAGHPDTRGCDRMCFYFWRTEWLEREPDSLVAHC
jgi:hypothetical protein